jgi:hypothetical protein
MRWAWGTPNGNCRTSKQTMHERRLRSKHFGIPTGWPTFLPPEQRPHLRREHLVDVVGDELGPEPRTTKLAAEREVPSSPWMRPESHGC